MLDLDGATRFQEKWVPVFRPETDQNHRYLELAAPVFTSPYFDIDDDQFAERTGWVLPDDGFLAHDANGNGTVDGIAELFGSYTTDGFTELTALDSNLLIGRGSGRKTGSHFSWNRSCDGVIDSLGHGVFELTHLARPRWSLCGVSDLAGVCPAAQGGQ